MELSSDKGIDWTEIVIPPEKMVIQVPDDGVERSGEISFPIKLGFHMDALTKTMELWDQIPTLQSVCIESTASTVQTELENTLDITQRGLSINIFYEPGECVIYALIEHDELQELISDSACDQALANVLG